MGYKSGEGLQWCIAGHAERNSLINSARMGIKTKHTTLYMDCGIPCTPCLVEIINAGVSEIVVSKTSFYDSSATGAFFLPLILCVELLILYVNDY